MPDAAATVRRYRDKIVHVVIPAYNEERQIEGVLRSMPEFLERLIVVDDASADDTAALVTRLQQEDERIVLLRHDRNQGVGGAIATGYAWARDHGADIATVMAGDGQMAPADLPALLDPVVDDTTDYAKGNRLVSGDAYRKIPKVRFFGNAILSLLTKIASGYWNVADSQTGYTAINRRALEAIPWDEMYKRYGMPNDLLVRLNVHGFRVKDVPIEPVYNVGEVSRLKVRRVVFTISWLLVKLFFWRLKEKYVIRDFHPLVFFYGLGFALFLANIGLFVRLIALWIIQGSVPEITALAWFFSFSTGLQALFFAMWFDYQSNKDLNP